MPPTNRSTTKKQPPRNRAHLRRLGRGGGDESASLAAPAASHSERLPIAVLADEADAAEGPEDELGFADHSIAGQGTPEAAVVTVVSVVAHHEELAGSQG